MKIGVAFPLCAILLVIQGCEKTRDFFSKKASQTLSTYSKNYGAELTEAEYQGFISQKGPLVVVNFGADWCKACHQLDPVLSRVAAEFGDDVKLGKLDVDKARNVAMQNGVKLLPDVRFFRNGRPVYQFNGTQPESELRETFKRLTESRDADEGRRPRTLMEKLLPNAIPEEPSETSETSELEEGPTIRPMEKDWMPPGIERR